jgi:hypothetical protein
MLLCELSCALVSDLKFNFFDGKIFFPPFAELLFQQNLLERSLQDELDMLLKNYGNLTKSSGPGQLLYLSFITVQKVI